MTQSSRSCFSVIKHKNWKQKDPLTCACWFLSAMGGRVVGSAGRQMESRNLTPVSRRGRDNSSEKFTVPQLFDQPASSALHLSEKKSCADVVLNWQFKDSTMQGILPSVFHKRRKSGVCFACQITPSLIKPQFPYNHRVLFLHWHLLLDQHLQGSNRPNANNDTVFK